MSPPPFDFTSDASVEDFNVPMSEFLKLHPEFDAIANGAFVFDAEGRLLVIQRVATDSWPLRWEVPGGGADREDPTLLYAVARELWEESGMMAKHIGGVVPCKIDVTGKVVDLDHQDKDKAGEKDKDGRGLSDPRGGAIFFSRSGLRCCKYAFQVDVEDTGALKLDPKEHVAYAWATEDQCRRRKVVVDGEERDIEFTSAQQEDVIFAAFAAKKKAQSG